MNHFQDVGRSWLAACLLAGCAAVLTGCDREKPEQDAAAAVRRNPGGRSGETRPGPGREKTPRLSPEKFRKEVQNLGQIGDSRELELEVLRKFGAELRDDPRAVLAVVDGIGDSSSRERIREAVLVTLVKENIKAAREIIPKLAAGKIADGILDRLVEDTARSEPAALEKLAKSLREGDRSALRSGLAHHYRTDPNAVGRFPSSALLASQPEGRAALESHLNGQGAPRDQSSLNTWVKGAEAIEDKKLAADAYRVLGQRNPEVAEKILQQTGRKIPGEYVEGVLKGVVAVDETRAGRLLLEQDDPLPFVHGVVSSWLEKDSFSASQWITGIPEERVRMAAVRSMIQWLKGKGNMKEAEDWSKMLPAE